MRGISSVAAFAIFIVVIVVFMLAVLYYYQLIKQATIQGVQYVRQSALPPDQEAALVYNGSCYLQAAGPKYPFSYYFSVYAPTGALFVSSAVSPASPYQFKIACPPGPGMYKYVGVRQSGQLAYLYVYVGPIAVWLQSNGTIYFVKRVGDSVGLTLYLNAYDNSTGWAPVQYSVALTYNPGLLSCSPQSLSAGPAALSPGQTGVYRLGIVRCTAKSSFTSTTIGAVITQSYGGYAWTVFVPAVAQLINASAASAPPPTSAACPASLSFSPSPGEVLSGYNELNGWIAAWGAYGGGAAVAVRPGVLVPDSLQTGTGPYYVQLKSQQIGTLAVSGAPATVTVSGSMPSFLSSLNITIGSSTVYLNGSSAAVTLQPGVYPVYVSVRVQPNASIAGSNATLYISCGSTQIPLLFEIPQWGDWGVRVDIYYNPSNQWGNQPNWQSYQYVGTWSVGSVYFWLSSRHQNPYGFAVSRPPYFSIAGLDDTAPKWAAAWLPQYSPGKWDLFALRYRGVLYIPWSDVNFGVWHDDGAYVSMCGVTLNAWYPTAPRFDFVKAHCSSSDVPVEIDYFEAYVESVLIFVVGKGSEAYIPTIDGAWYCPNFTWKSGPYSYGPGPGYCNSLWYFLPASSGNVPYFVVGKYTPGTSDGGGTPAP
ncbi:hypothetical protein [Thermoproteus tenax]|uniref:Type II/IV secretion system component, FlgK family n=1 Tax=Thermoproteus tenax (strain ATCC 35583 / DSM 2078 / JCM 9277 / NBRC 100435 / Kra 1) TaxID=768679 RepID=G4RJM5_THETK|nr:hypothetical protein [Thermoproteus tenax]CCC81770.1 Type II/IV secretion system component, FlgK family [Thermoproteus tenax Kra 1]